MGEEDSFQDLALESRELIIGKVEPKKLTLPAEAASLEPAFQKCKTQLGL